MKIIALATVLTAALATSVAASTLNQQFSSFVVFGDSLSDNGNLFGANGVPPAPYADGRFSNGPVWAEGISSEFPGGNSNILVDGVGSGSVNAAFGGARADNDPNPQGAIPSVPLQIATFLAFGGTFAPDTLVSHWAGANDLFQDLPSAANVAEAEAFGRETAADVAANLTALRLSGARNLLVFNLPDLGLSPRYPSAMVTAEAATAATIAFNTDLANALSMLELFHPEVNVFSVDVFSIFNAIVDDPDAFGLANATDACFAVLACIAGGTNAQNSFLFFDDVHPTQTGHGLIEAAARQALAPVPLPAGAPLLLVALLGLGALSRRRA